MIDTKEIRSIFARMIFGNKIVALCDEVDRLRKALIEIYERTDDPTTVYLAQAALKGER